MWDGLNNKNTVSTNLLSDKDVIQVEYEDSNILIVKVPRAEYTHRPVYLTLNPFGGHMYRRRHEGDYKASDDVVRRMIGDSLVSSSPLDNKIFKHFEIGDEIDPTTIRQYRQMFTIKHNEHPWNDLPDLKFLEKIGAYRIDKEEGLEGFTLAGVLMFGTQKGLEDAMPHYFIDYRERLSTNPEIRWTDRVYPDGYWEPNLYQFYSRVYPKIQQALPTPFKLEGGSRVDDTPAHNALREAFINCMVHAVYGMMNCIVIERYPDRLVFRNPGTMLVSVEQYFKGGTSICRNSTLQKIFSFVGGNERAGSGADMIVTAWADNNWPKPQLIELYDPDMVELTLFVGKQDGRTSAENERKTTKKTTKKTTEKTTTREIILDAIKNNPSLTNKELATICGITADGVYYQLKQMKTSGLIRRVGPDNGGHWEIIK